MQHFHALKCDAERNKLWLVVWHVGQMVSWAGLGQWKLPWIPDLQPSVSSQVKLSFIVIPLHGAYSGTKRRASQDHGAT